MIRYISKAEVHHSYVLSDEDGEVSVDVSDDFIEEYKQLDEAYTRMQDRLSTLYESMGYERLSDSD